MNGFQAHINIIAEFDPVWKTAKCCDIEKAQVHNRKIQLIIKIFPFGSK